MMNRFIERNVKEIQEGILGDMKIFSNGTPQNDDVTLVLMKVNPLFPVNGDQQIAETSRSKTKKPKTTLKRKKPKKQRKYQHFVR